MIVAEVKLANVAAKMPFTDVLVNTGQTALEDREVVFNGIGVDRTANVFVSGMVDRVMLKLMLKIPVILRIVSHYNGVFGNLLSDDRAQGFGPYRRNMERADFPVTFDKGEDFHLVMRPTSGPLELILPSALVAPIGFVGFNDSTGAAHLLHKDRIAHGFADAVSHKPRGLVSHVQHPVHLVAGMALLGGTQ